MKKISANIVVKSIQKVVGKGSHQLHEPLFFGKEMDYLKNTIKKKEKNYLFLNLYIKDL